MICEVVLYCVEFYVVVECYFMEYEFVMFFFDEEGMGFFEDFGFGGFVFFG